MIKHKQRLEARAVGKALDILLLKTGLFLEFYAIQSKVTPTKSLPAISIPIAMKSAKFLHIFR
jgi:hypothetical protein